jgi:ubiquinone/menaquinone biosynthesis C-methylase UbiE
MRILDLGCGSGNPRVRSSFPEKHQVIGIDLDLASLRAAKQMYPSCHFLRCRAESLPFRENSFERVVANVSIPYTNIPPALSEVKRVLSPGGSLLMSIHPLRFTLAELRCAIPYPKAVLFRLYVLANGVIFHFSGRTVPFLDRGTESFQTIRGIKLALRRAGYIDVSTNRPDGRFIVETRVPTYLQPRTDAVA